LIKANCQNKDQIFKKDPSLGWQLGLTKVQASALCVWSNLQFAKSFTASKTLSQNALFGCFLLFPAVSCWTMHGISWELLRFPSCHCPGPDPAAGKKQEFPRIPGGRIKNALWQELLSQQSETQVSTMLALLQVQQQVLVESVQAHGQLGTEEGAVRAGAGAVGVQAGVAGSSKQIDSD